MRLLSRRVSTSSRWRTARPRFAGPGCRARNDAGGWRPGFLVGAPVPGWYRPAGLRGWLSRSSRAAAGVDASRDQARLGARREDEGTPGRVVTTPPAPVTGAGPDGPAGPGAATIGGLDQRPATTSCSAGAAGPGQRVATAHHAGTPARPSPQPVRDHRRLPHRRALRRPPPPLRDPDPGHRDLPPYPSVAPGSPSRKPKRGAPS